MTTIADLTRTDRRRLLEQLDETNELDRLMREPGTLAGPDEPEPLHRAGRNNAERTTSS
jgi:hypothetical protein